MNFITIKEAIKATGRSERTIRRLLSKAESQAFTSTEDGKTLINVNYLFSVYPPVKTSQNTAGNTSGKSMPNTSDSGIGVIPFMEAQYLNEIQLYKKLLEEKDQRIADLQNTIRLLDYKKQEEKDIHKKKKWWQF